MTVCIIVRVDIGSLPGAWICPKSMRRGAHLRRRLEHRTGIDMAAQNFQHAAARIGSVVKTEPAFSEEDVAAESPRIVGKLWGATISSAQAASPAHNMCAGACRKGGPRVVQAHARATSRGFWLQNQGMHALCLPLFVAGCLAEIGRTPQPETVAGLRSEADPGLK